MGNGGGEGRRAGETTENALVSLLGVYYREINQPSLCCNGISIIFVFISSDSILKFSRIPSCLAGKVNAISRGV